MEQDNRSNVRREPVFSMKLRAGRKRTYFFDIRPTRSNDYYLTITESKKKFNEDGYERHKIFLYKEDFNRFLDIMNQTINHAKTELMPDYDFDEFNRPREHHQSTNLHIEDVKFDESTKPSNGGNQDSSPAESSTPVEENKDVVEDVKSDDTAITDEKIDMPAESTDEPGNTSKVDDEMKW